MVAVVELGGDPADPAARSHRVRLSQRVEQFTAQLEQWSSWMEFLRFLNGVWRIKCHVTVLKKKDRR